MCGDGSVGAGETCDDGNTINGDLCNENCAVELCGDGIVVAGQFCPSDTSELAVGTLPQSIALGDLDGDGVLDIVIANAGDNNVSIMIQNP